MLDTDFVFGEICVRGRESLKLSREMRQVEMNCPQCIAYYCIYEYNTILSHILY